MDGSRAALGRLGHPLFAEKWPQKKAFWIGVHLSQGLTFTSIARRLNDGSRPNQLTAMASSWGYRPAGRHTYVEVAIPLPPDVRAGLERDAQSRGLPLEALCQRILKVTAKDQLIDAVLGPISQE